MAAVAGDELVLGNRMAAVGEAAKSKEVEEARKRRYLEETKRLKQDIRNLKQTQQKGKEGTAQTDRVDLQNPISLRAQEAGDPKERFATKPSLKKTMSKEARPYFDRHSKSRLKIASQEYQT